MHPVASALHQMGGIAPLTQLRSGGFAESTIRLACDRGHIQRLRRGWYAVPGANAQLAAAIIIGGRLGCVSACAARGIWQPPFAGLHVAVARGANHLAHLSRDAELSLGGARLHWMASRSTFLTEAQPLIEALAASFSCQPEEYAFAMLESALHLRLLQKGDKKRLKRRVAMRHWAVIDFADSLSESGSESVFRFLAHLDGIEMLQQVRFLDVARVDFVIGDRLIVEIDSEAHHGSPAQRRRDLERDALLAAHGGITLRFDYQMVFWDWPLVRAALRGAHRYAVRSER